MNHTQKLSHNLDITIMLYSIPFTYNEASHGSCHRVDAQLIFDLPQNTLEEARYNLLVRDIVRDAHIRHFYSSNPKYEDKPESILQESSIVSLQDTIQIRVVYQLAPNDDNWESFVMYIYMLTEGDPSNIPFKELTFTCRNEFYAYREAFLHGFIVSGATVVTPCYRKGNLLKIYNSTTYDIGKVVEDNNEIRIKIVGEGDGNVTYNGITKSCISSIEVTGELLQLLGASWFCGDLGGKTECWYELSLENGTVLKLFSQANRQYLLIEQDDSEEKYRQKEFIGLDGLQNVIQDEYNVHFVPTKIRDIEKYIRNVHSQMLFVLNYPKFIEKYNKDTDYGVVLKGMMDYFGINKDVAEYYLAEYVSRGYFKK